MDQITPILSQKIDLKQNQLDEFFNSNFQKHPPLFCNSVDIRNSGFKTSIVDTNCFPAGFNNLTNQSLQIAIKHSSQFLKQYFQDCKNIIIIPENHTRNLNYLENIRFLTEILSANNNVKIGTLITDIEQSTKLETATGLEIELHPLHLDENNNIAIKDFTADLVILNNDLSEGLPQIFKQCQTPIIPSPEIGWHKRSKFNHLSIFNEIALEISKIIKIDPWFISSKIDFCENLNFKETIGVEELANKVDKLIAQIAEKYQQYGIQQKPHCFIKADSGTYGMAISVVKSGEEILTMNKKLRNKMNATKGSIQNNKVVIQEGIPTIHSINNMPAEPLIYMIGGNIVGDLFRANEQRDNINSLNAMGATFYDRFNLDSLATKKQNEVILQSKKANHLVARIAALASAKEVY